MILIMIFGALEVMRLRFWTWVMGWDFWVPCDEDNGFCIWKKGESLRTKGQTMVDRKIGPQICVCPAILDKLMLGSPVTEEIRIQ